MSSNRTVGAQRQDGADERADDGLVELAQQLQVFVVRLSRRLRQHAGETELTPSQLSSLFSIGRAGPLSLGELARRELVAAPSITRIVRRLEAAGLVVRQADPADGRVWRVAVSGAGRARLGHVQARREGYLAGLLSQLPPGERRDVERALVALNRLLDEGRR